MSSSSLLRRRLRIVAINDVYELRNLPRLASFLGTLSPEPSAVVLAGDFLSPSALSSIDSGRGMVATVRSCGVTHAILGNREADLSGEALKERMEELTKSVTVINTNVGRSRPKRQRDGGGGGGGDSDVEWLSSSDLTVDHAIISTPCRSVNVALLGLMTDEPNAFRSGPYFRGTPISNVLDAFSFQHEHLVRGKTRRADLVVPVTHQSVGRDRDLARRMMDVGMRRGVVVGGHEHHPIDEVVTTAEKGGGDDGGDDDNNDGPSSFVRILKAGTDAERASLIDLDFDASSDPPRLVDVEASFVDLTSHAESAAVRRIADGHSSVLRRLENEIAIDGSMVPGESGTLSSERSRFEQTTMGAFLCSAIREELDADVALINGGSVKGGRSYPNDEVSYAQLKEELPFPTKMVVVDMTRGELLDAIEYSRTNVERRGGEEEKAAAGKSAAASSSEGNDEAAASDVERRGYLQVDSDFDAESYESDLDETLRVALPRNLLKGFCDIRPLVDLGVRLESQNAFPGEDEYTPALDLVTRRCCKSRWRQISDAATFDDIDLNDDGVLDRNEIRTVMTNVLGRVPDDLAVDRMIEAVDADGDGKIDAGEFSYLLAVMERDRALRTR